MLVVVLTLLLLMFGHGGTERTPGKREGPLAGAPFDESGRNLRRHLLFTLGDLTFSPPSHRPQSSALDRKRGS